eukprot:3830337-Rhodomonas_salina.1
MEEPSLDTSADLITGSVALSPIENAEASSQNFAEGKQKAEESDAAEAAAHAEGNGAAVSDEGASDSIPPTVLSMSGAEADPLGRKASGVSTDELPDISKTETSMPGLSLTSDETNVEDRSEKLGSYGVILNAEADKVLEEAQEEEVKGEEADKDEVVAIEEGGREEEEGGDVMLLTAG